MKVKHFVWPLAVIAVGAVGYMCIAHAAILDALTGSKKTKETPDDASDEIRQ